MVHTPNGEPADRLWKMCHRVIPVNFLSGTRRLALLHDTDSEPPLMPSSDHATIRIMNGQQAVHARKQHEECSTRASSSLSMDIGMCACKREEFVGLMRTRNPL